MKNFPCDILRNKVEIGWYRANAGPIQASTSTFITVCPVYWLSTVCTVAGTNGTRQYNASFGPILVCLLGRSGGAVPVIN